MERDKSNMWQMLRNLKNIFKREKTLDENTAQEVNEEITKETQQDEIKKLKKEILNLPCYWPNFSRLQAQKYLSDKPNGSFLIRDSSDPNSFALSFRTREKTFHSRNLWCHVLNSDKLRQSGPGLTAERNSSFFVNLIERSMAQSTTSSQPLIGYLSGMSSVRLVYPLQRNYKVLSLQTLCMNQIKSATSQQNINSLPLPVKIKDFVKDNYDAL